MDYDDAIDILRQSEALLRQVVGNLSNVLVNVDRDEVSAAFVEGVRAALNGALDALDYTSR